MLKENIKTCTTMFFLIFILYLIINVLPSIVSSYNTKGNILSNLEEANAYLGEKRDSIISKTNNDIEDYISNNDSISMDRLRNNLVKRSNEYQESSEKAKNLIKKYTGIDMGKVAEKFFSLESYN